MTDYPTWVRDLFDAEVLNLRAQIAAAKRAYHHERVAKLAADLAAYRAKFPQFA